ncbi:DNA protecting protein DprA [Marivivens niveibacter]|uniref:DNA protecting protein DprA n=1 Tax=Marivivens niveibacter TaxID=1930667 RepID=A0A251WWZ7_9RHOB|nr:DNA-processing protein DprA [Marivivens niveibacter]OUD08892.1 DNA protecting protein DprA [Marivivens niveibacter]
MPQASQSSFHPPLPPTTEEDRFNRLRLLRSRRVGVSTYHRLMAEHGSAAAALEALPQIAAAAGVRNYEICPEGVIHAELKSARKAKARMICIGEPEYPTDLADINDAPPFLWAIGNADLLQRPMIALIGARNASSLGTRMARKLATELAEAGYVVVSGLARGIDAAVHSVTVDSGTIAVLGGGVDVIYPQENTDLFHAIGAKGLRLSEQPIGLQPQARHFPARNRIISGLCRATVVVEAAQKSGSLITADTALAQGRDVMAVPGHPFDGRAGGCNALIRDGATLVRSADDILQALEPITPQMPLDLPPQKPAPQKRSLRETADLHTQILSQLGPSPIAEDQVLRDLKLNPKQAGPAIVDLELDGRIQRQPGGMISLMS